MFCHSFILWIESGPQPTSWFHNCPFFPWMGWWGSIQSMSRLLWTSKGLLPPPSSPDSRELRPKWHIPVSFLRRSLRKTGDQEPTRHLRGGAPAPFTLTPWPLSSWRAGSGARSQKPPAGDRQPSLSPGLSPRRFFHQHGGSHFWQPYLKITTPDSVWLTIQEAFWTPPREDGMRY